MENSKPWYLSKRMQGLITSAIGLSLLALKHYKGIDIEFNEISVSNSVGQFMTIVGQMFAVYGSAVAKHKLTLK